MVVDSRTLQFVQERGYVDLLVVLFFIWLGARLGSIGIGLAGGFGVLVLAVVFG